MIIDITKSGYRKGYLPKVGTGVFHPFFATANAAFRRDALLQVGGFDEHCDTGEDIDVSIRVARAGWELWFEPSARVLHSHRTTLRGLLRQWFRYGFGHAYLFRKHSPRRLEVYRYDLREGSTSPFGIQRLLALPFPCHGMVFVSRFHLMHVALLAAVTALLLGWTMAGAALLTAAAVLGVWYASLRFDPTRPLWSCGMTALRYVADATYVLGGLLGGLRERMIFVEATRTRRGARTSASGS